MKKNSDLLDDILSLEQNEHLTIVESSKKDAVPDSEDELEEKEKAKRLEESLYQKFDEKIEPKKKKKFGLISWLKKIYGLEDDEQEDLNFIYSSYAASNEEPGKLQIQFF